MSEFVSIPCPVERVQEVYELLARPPVRFASGRQTSQDDGSVSWTRELIDRMFVESSSAMKRILRAIARRSPSWVTTSEIAEASGLTARQVAASLGPFEKRVRGRYGMNRWPFSAREFVDAGVLKYSMAPETADWILALVAQEEEHG